MNNCVYILHIQEDTFLFSLILFMSVSQSLADFSLYICRSTNMYLFSCGDFMVGDLFHDDACGNSAQVLLFFNYNFFIFQRVISANKNYLLGNQYLRLELFYLHFL